MPEAKQLLWKLLFALDAGAIMGMLTWYAAARPVGFAPLMLAYLLGASGVYTYHKAVRRVWKLDDITAASVGATLLFDFLIIMIALFRWRVWRGTWVVLYLAVILFANYIGFFLMPTPAQLGY